MDSDRQPDSHSLVVEVGVWQHLNFAEIAPLLDALNERFETVRARRYNRTPIQAGGPDVFITLTAADFVIGAGSAAAVIVLKTFLEELGKDSYKLVRQQLHQLFKKSPREHGNMWVPLVIQVGAVRFYFEGIETDEEFVKRLRAALEVAAALPESGIGDEAGPSEMGLEWDEESGAWRGEIISRDGSLRYTDGKWQHQKW